MSSQLLFCVPSPCGFSVLGLRMKDHPFAIPVLCQGEKDKSSHALSLKLLLQRPLCLFLLKLLEAVMLYFSPQCRLWGSKQGSNSLTEKAT